MWGRVLLAFGLGLLIGQGGMVRAETAPPGLAAESVGPVEAVVNRVIDGSSLDAQVAGNRTAVGYLGAETPPLNQSCGPEALARNGELAGSRVILQADPAYSFDSLGRRLYYASTPEGVSIDETLIGEGLARATRLDAARGADLAAVQAEAEAAGRGCLWAAR